eukprot:1159568-Pelagomonas_calceolata.AAC.4
MLSWRSYAPEQDSMDNTPLQGNRITAYFPWQVSQEHIWGGLQEGAACAEHRQPGIRKKAWGPMKTADVSKQSMHFLGEKQALMCIPTTLRAAKQWPSSA